MLQRRVFKLLTDLRIEDKNGYFREPVNSAAAGVPDYHAIVTTPIDFSTIESRYHRNEYADASQQMLTDIGRVFDNARLYNASVTHPIHVEAVRLQALRDERWAELSRCLASDQAIQMQACRKLVNKLLRDPEEVQPFMQPVDASIAPDYANVISTPMSISAVLAKLNTRPCLYQSSDDFACDVEQIWINCAIYNGAQHSLTVKANRLRGGFRRAFQRDFGVFTIAHERECRERCIGGGEEMPRKRQRLEESSSNAPLFRAPQPRQLPHNRARVAPIVTAAPPAKPPKLTQPPPLPVAAHRPITAQQRRLLIEVARKKQAEFPPLAPLPALPVPPAPALSPPQPESSESSSLRPVAVAVQDDSEDDVICTRHRFIVSASTLAHLNQLDWEKLRPSSTLHVSVPAFSVVQWRDQMGDDAMLQHGALCYLAKQRLVEWKGVQLRHVTIRLASLIDDTQHASVATIRVVAIADTVEPVKFKALESFAQLRAQLRSYAQYKLECTSDYDRLRHPMSCSPFLNDIERLFDHVPISDLVQGVQWQAPVCTYAYKCRSTSGEQVVHLLCPDDDIVNIELNGQVLDTTQFSREQNRLFVDAHADQLYRSWLARMQAAELEASTKRAEQAQSSRLLLQLFS